MGNHPLFSQQAQHPGSMPKALCRIATECESIPDHCQEKEIGIHFPTLDREERGGEKHHGVGPQIALSPTWMTPPAFGHAECYDACNARHQSCPRLHNEWEEEGERDAKDEHKGFPSFQISLPSGRNQNLCQCAPHGTLLHSRSTS